MGPRLGGTPSHARARASTQVPPLRAPVVPLQGSARTTDRGGAARSLLARAPSAGRPTPRSAVYCVPTVDLGLVLRLQVVLLLTLRLVLYLQLVLLQTLQLVLL